jgi:16S rRNA (cytidine1402-2'-O)-methyltransferase
MKRFKSFPFGPSSILLAMMASGMNGPSFTFHGYLPIERGEKKKALKFRTDVFRKNQSQIFIETPYRNNKLLEDLIQILNQETHLCIATDITLPTEYIKTKKNSWKKNYRFA